jgi:probable HAF family extracellular repeat protein
MTSHLDNTFAVAGQGLAHPRGRHTRGAVVGALGALLSSATVLCANAIAAPLAYTVIKLEGPSGSTSSTATNINNAGQVIGYSSANDGSSQAVRWQGATMAATGLGTLGGGNSYGESINDAGRAIGTSNVLSRTDFSPTFWDGVMPTRLGAATDLGNVHGINNAGDMVGIRSGPTDLYKIAVLWRGAAVIELSAQESYAAEINELGQIVGSVTSAVTGLAQATVWNNLAPTELSALPGGAGSQARSINSTGQVVGDTTFLSGNTPTYRATAWSGVAGARPLDLGTLGGLDSFAEDINDAGQIVGASFTANGEFHAAMWDGGSIIDLNSFLSVDLFGAGWFLQSALGINNNGWIAANAQNRLTNETQAVLLKPSATAVPEPASYALVLLALGGMAVTASSRWRRH